MFSTQVIKCWQSSQKRKQNSSSIPQQAHINPIKSLMNKN